MVGRTPKAIRYRFGPFEIIADEASLSRTGIRVKFKTSHTDFC